MVVSPSTASSWLCLPYDGGASRPEASWLLATSCSSSFCSPPSTPFPRRGNRPSPKTSSIHLAPLPRRRSWKTNWLVAPLLHSHLLATATAAAAGVSSLGQIGKPGVPIVFDEHAHLLQPARRVVAHYEGEERQASKARTKAPPTTPLCVHQVKMLLLTHVSLWMDRYPRSMLGST